MADADGGQKRGVTFEPTFNLNTVITIIGLLMAGAVPFFVLRGDVGVIRNNQENVARALIEYHDSAARDFTKLTASVDAINQLIIVRSGDRYTKQDGQRDQDIIREHFNSIEGRLANVENHGQERDRQLDQVLQTLNSITGAIKATRPLPR